MAVMNKQEVIRELEACLVRLEVTGEKNEGKMFTKIIDYYSKESYNLEYLNKKYHEICQKLDS